MRKLFTVLAVLGVVAVGALLWVLRQPVSPELEDPGGLVADEQLGTRSVTLFFPDDQAQQLLSETRTIQAMRHSDEEVEAVVLELLAGPSRDGAIAGFPAGTGLRHAFFDDDRGILYLDFTRELVGPGMAGSATELMALGSLLRTIAVDFPEVVAVQLLVEGLEVETLGGHVDTTRPLRPGDWL